MVTSPFALIKSCKFDEQFHVSSTEGYAAPEMIAGNQCAKTWKIGTREKKSTGSTDQAAFALEQITFMGYLVAHPTNRKWVTTLVINGISGGNVHL